MAEAEIESRQIIGGQARCSTKLVSGQGISLAARMDETAPVACLTNRRRC